MSDIIRCKVTVDKVFYPKNGKMLAGEWASFSCRIDQVIEGHPREHAIYKTISCKGRNVPHSLKGEVYTLIASETYDSKWGYQYEVISMGTEYDLESEEDQKTFLSFILSVAQIKMLYKSLKNPFEVIKNKDVATLTAIKGIGVQKANSIIERFENNEMNGSAYVELAAFGLTKLAMDKLIKIFGVHNAGQILKENPYKIIDCVSGYGWKKADAMALNSGIGVHDLRRVRGFINYYFLQRENEGHSYISPQELYDATTEAIEGVPDENIKIAMHNLFEDGVIWWDDTKTKIFSLRTINLEKNITEELLRIKDAKSSLTYKSLDSILPAIEQRNGWEFTDEQKQAVNDTLQSNVSIITGFGGTGKSSVVSAILQCYEDVIFAQTALAGRAAARLSEVTGEDGFTIHRLLGFGSDGFVYKKDNKLPFVLIILDEISMVGGYIFYSLIQAIQDGAKLIMLGDVGQLESIGVLNLFRDMLDCKTISVSHLTKIHRQAAKSAIITTSMHVRNQEQLFKKGFTGSEIRGDLQDLKLDIYEESALSKRKVLRHYRELIEQGIDPNDIQVIVPMKIRGDISTFNINPDLKLIANPDSQGGITRSKMVGDVNKIYTLNVGDRVINMRNNYEALNIKGEKTPIYNGNMGVITCVDDEYMEVDFFQWGKVIIPPKSFSEIELAYAITCHKIQGSQSPYVIVCFDNSAYTMLCREWLYTAITRAKEYCILCAQGDAVRSDIGISRIPEKQTMLRSFLDREYPIENIPSVRIPIMDD